MGLRTLTQNIGLLWRSCGVSSLRYGIRKMRHAPRRESPTLGIPRNELRWQPRQKRSYKRRNKWTKWIIWATLITSTRATLIVAITVGPKPIVWVTVGGRKEKGWSDGSRWLHHEKAQTNQRLTIIPNDDGWQEHKHSSTDQIFVWVIDNMHKH